MLSPSELILNPDGSIYHLRLHPGQVAKTILTVGDPARVERITRHFDRVDEVVRYREFLTHTGELAGKRLTVISTGIGTDNIDIVLNELDALFNIDFKARRVKEELEVLDFIRIGTAGGLQPDIPVNTIVCSAFGVGLDGLMPFYQFPTNAAEEALQKSLMDHLDPLLKMPVQPIIHQGSTELLDQIGQDLLRGITMTCSGFYAPQGRQLRAKTSTDDYLSALSTYRGQELSITNFEMETAGIYGLSRVLGHRALSISAILANRTKGTFSQQPKKAVDDMIELVLERVV